MKIPLLSIRSGWVWLFTAIFYLQVIALQAAPILGKLYEFRQPDGSSVQVRVFGDEYYQRVESLDGYTLVRDENGWISYAKLSTDGSRLVSTGVVYKGAKLSQLRLSEQTATLEKGLDLSKAAILKQREEVRQKLSKPAAPTKKQQRLEDASTDVVGAVKGLAVLVDFSDEPATVSQTEFDSFFNQIGYTGFGNNGSVRDFFKEVSSNKLDYTNIVRGYYRAKKPKTYYDDASDMAHAGELLDEVYAWLEAQNFDFTALSTTSGEIRAVNLFYAGNPTNGWSKGLWPHSGWHYYATQSGVNAGPYQMTDIGASLGIGTICHENGHMIAHWPDLYDYDGGGGGAGGFCLMAGGSHAQNPVPPNPYFRALVGWETHTPMSTNAQFYTLTSNAYTALSFKKPSNPKESFLIESRLRTGRNANFPGEGLLIWHIDEYGNNSREEMTPEQHFYVSVEAADGLYDLEHGVNGGDENDFFRAGYKTNFNDVTVPNATWWDGAFSGLVVSDVSAIGATMTATIRTNGLLQTPSQVEASQSSASSVALRWIDNASSETGYRVERKVGNGTFAVYATLAANSTSYTDASVSANTFYTYRVLALGTSYNSAYSNEVALQVKPWINLALNKTTSTSTAPNTSYLGKFAVDGVATTRWTSALADPQWIYVDLQQSYYIQKVNIVWEAAAKNFKIQVSNNASTWVDVVTTTNNTSLTTGYSIFSTQARYVRVYGTTRAVTTKGYSIYELQVFGSSNTPPTVQAPSAINGSPFLVTPWTTQLTTTAADVDGSISKVEFYAGTTLIGSSTVSPYTVVWQNVAAGSYAVTAKAFDNSGLSTVSSPFNVTVTTAPTVSWTAPLNLSEFNAPANVTLGATASDPDGPVSKVEFWQDNGSSYDKLGEDLTAPYSLALTNLPAGTYKVYAKAYDNLYSIANETQRITFTVKSVNTPPTVSFNTPANFTHYPAPASFQIKVAVNDQEGPIANVEFYQDGVKIGEDNLYPEFYWYLSNLPAGTYVFTAKAYDQGGLVTTSAPLTVYSDGAATCVLTEIAPVATQWALRNDWSDQNSGSTLTNESSALKVSHRAYGQNQLWVLDNNKFPIVNGQTYTVKFDVKDFAGYALSGTEVGLSSTTGTAGPTLVQPVVAVPSGYSSSAFTTKTVNITATSTQNVGLAIKLKWASQPNVAVTDYIKNVTVCKAVASAPRAVEVASDEFESQELVVAPNPATDQLGLAGFFEGQVVFEARDLRGTLVLSETSHFAKAGQSTQLAIGSLSPGIYTLSVKTETKTWVKTFVKQ